MPTYLVRHSQANQNDDAPLPEWLVVDSRHDEDPRDEWVVSRHSFPEEAEAKAEKLNTEEQDNREEGD